MQFVHLGDRDREREKEETLLCHFYFYQMRERTISKQFISGPISHTIPIPSMFKVK